MLEVGAQADEGVEEVAAGLLVPDGGSYIREDKVLRSLDRLHELRA